MVLQQTASATDGFATAPDIESPASARKSVKSTKAKTSELTPGECIFRASQIRCIMFMFFCTASSLLDLADSRIGVLEIFK